MLLHVLFNNSWFLFLEHEISAVLMKNIRLVAEKTTIICVHGFEDMLVDLMRGEIESYRYDIYSGREKHFMTSASK
jgi:hypothetical protein